MTLTLTPEQEAVLDKTVRVGQFRSREEAAVAAITALAERFSSEEEGLKQELRSKYPTLADLFRNSPLIEANIELERDKSPLREVHF